MYKNNFGIENPSQSVLKGILFIMNFKLHKVCHSVGNSTMYLRNF